MTREMRLLWDDLIQEHNQQLTDRMSLHDVFLRVGRRAIQKGATTDTLTVEETELPATGSEQPVEDDQAEHTVLFQPLPPFPAEAVLTLGPLSETVHQWIEHVQTRSDSQVEWVSMYQLLISFQLWSGSMGPVKKDRGWVDADKVYQHGIGFDFLQHCKWFAAYLKQLGRVINLNITGEFRRPSGSDKIQVWTRCYRFCISRAVLQEVDMRLHAHKIFL